MTKIVSIFLSMFLLATAATAQEMPAPRRMPRVPVSREVLAQPAMPTSKEVQGPAAIIDGEKLRIGDTDLRLFGVVPPQLAASFGPQARSELDTLASGQNVSCQIRDRDRDGRLLATCRNAAGADMALELLKHGLAVTARGSIAGTELAAAYAAAEQAAQNQKIGLWSVAVSAPVAVAAVPATQVVKPEAAKPEVAKQESISLNDGGDIKKDDKTAKSPAPETQTQAKIAADLLSQRAEAQARIDDTLAMPSDEVGFFERYQILISGFLMLATALSVIGALWAQKSRDRRDEVKALAAALRGELMAARSICAGRAKNITAEIDDRLAIWPRIRSTLYQAYVGRLGLLGAELARQVASIYGQSSDYAALYNTSASAQHEVSKKQALETLAKRIDEVLPRLAEIEKIGRIPAGKFRPAPAEGTPTHTFSTSPQAVFRAAFSALEGARNFIQNYRAVIVPTVAPAPPLPIDPQIAEYAAIIEADMALYQDRDNVEPLDLPLQKKRG